MLVLVLVNETNLSALLLQNSACVKAIVLHPVSNRAVGIELTVY